MQYFIEMQCKVFSNLPPIYFLRRLYYKGLQGRIHGNLLTKQVKTVLKIIQDVCKNFPIVEQSLRSSQVFS